MGASNTKLKLDEYAVGYLNRIADDEDAFFALLEAPVALFPFLESAFRTESEPRKTVR